VKFRIRIGYKEGKVFSRPASARVWRLKIKETFWIRQISFGEDQEILVLSL
jgi:hypothetical protein